MNSQDFTSSKKNEATIRCLKILSTRLFLAADRRLSNQSYYFEKPRLVMCIMTNHKCLPPVVNKHTDKEEHFDNFVCTTPKKLINENYSTIQILLANFIIIIVCNTREFLLETIKLEKKFRENERNKN